MYVLVSKINQVKNKSKLFNSGQGCGKQVVTLVESLVFQ